jgi:hypothetical protein
MLSQPLNEGGVLRRGQPLVQRAHEPLIVLGKQCWAVNPQAGERTHAVDAIGVGLHLLIGAQVEPAELLVVQADNQILLHTIVSIIQQLLMQIDGLARQGDFTYPIRSATM